MADNKKSFLLYCDLIHTVSKMPKDKAGELFMHILEYVNDKNPETDDLIIQLTFEPIKQALKRDLQKYENIRLKNIENANKRWNKNNATAYDRIQTDTKNAVNDNVNDNVSVNVNDNKSVVVKKDINDIEVDFDKNTFKDIEDLKKYYLTDLRLRNAFCKSNKFLNAKLPDRLLQFNNHLESQSRFKETFTEYAKHFLAWHRKAPDENSIYQKKQKVNAGELIKQKYGLS